MSNPFEAEDGIFHVLVNDEGQHSLWPNFIDTPAGWRIIYGPHLRAACREYVNKNWKDMRPVSLAKLMDEAADRRKRDL